MGAGANGSLEDREGAGSELMLLDLSDFIFAMQQSVSDKHIEGELHALTSTQSAASRGALCNTLATLHVYVKVD